MAKCPEAYMALPPEGDRIIISSAGTYCLGRRAMAVPPSERQEFHPDAPFQSQRLFRLCWQKLAARKRIDRQFRTIGLVLATSVATANAVLIFLPDTYYPDHLRSSRLSSINLIKCKPEQSVPMRCVMLGNGERFSFQQADDQTVVQWTQSRIEKEYSEAVVELYRQSLQEGGSRIGASFVFGLAVYAAFVAFGWMLSGSARD
jgi:hypothetical protein